MLSDEVTMIARNELRLGRDQSGPYEGASLTNQHLDSDVRDTMFQLQSQVNAVAQIVGGPLFGLLTTEVSEQVVLLVAGVILAFTLIVSRFN